MFFSIYAIAKVIKNIKKNIFFIDVFSENMLIAAENMLIATVILPNRICRSPHLFPSRGLFGYSYRHRLFFRKKDRFSPFL